MSWLPPSPLILPRRRVRRVDAAPTRETLEVSGRAVEIVRRAYKRSISLTLKMNGTLRVSAPKGVSSAKISDFIISQEEWIRAGLKKFESVRDAYPAKTFREGELFPFLGHQLPLTFEPCSGRTRPSFKIRDGKLICQIRREVWSIFDPHAPHPELRKSVVAFYKQKARDVLLSSIHTYSNRLQLFPTALSFRGQKTRWGSCSSRGRISLNWKMIVAPIEVIDYVVIHELSHLKYYDHSAQFWSLVETQDPDYREHRTWLRVNQYQADFLARESELHA